MAKISNTTAYPNITPQGTDYLVLTDTSAANATKTVTVQALADFISVGNVTLQEVLDAGNTATEDINLTGNYNGTGNITLTGNYSGVGTITNQGSLTLTSGTGTFPQVDINGGNIDNTQIGVNAASRAVLASVSTSEALRLVSFNTVAPALWIQTGGLKAKDVAGTASYGNDGDVLISKGSGGTTSDQVPRWAAPLSILDLPAKHIYIGSSVAPNVDKPVASALIAVDDSNPALPLFDITIGNPTPTQTLVQGLFYANVVHPYAENNLSYGEESLIDPSLTGVNNTAIGLEALRNLTSGEDNTSLGAQALRNQTIGSSNVAIGTNSLFSSTQGSDNIAIGKHAAGNSVDSIRNIAIGTEALRNVTGNTNNQNIAIGWRSADALTAGEKNVVIGAQALGVQSTASSFSTIIGESAGGNANIVAGMNQAVLIGFEAGWGATDDRVVAIGYQAGRVNAGAANVFIGRGAGVVNTGNGNTLVGSEVGLVSAASSQNTFIGSGTASSLTSGDANTFIGERNGSTAATSNSLVLVGRGADVNGAADSTAVAVGTSSIVSTEATALGHAAQANGVGSIALGNGAISTQPAGFNIRNLAQGGLTSFADRAAALAAGLLPGDVYVLTPGGPDNPGTSFVLAII